MLLARNVVLRWLPPLGLGHTWMASLSSCHATWLARPWTLCSTTSHPRATRPTPASWSAGALTAHLLQRIWILPVFGGPVGELDQGDFSQRAPVPIGTPEYRNRIAQAALEGTRKATDAVVALPDRATVTSPAVQCGLLLARMCVTPRAIHLLHSAFSDDIIDLASSFDAVFRAGFESPTGISIVAGTTAERQLRTAIDGSHCAGCMPGLLDARLETR